MTDIDPLSMHHACQQGVGTKAFTGRGEAPKRVHQCEIDLSKLHQQMCELSETTRKLPGRAFYLAVHRRNHTCKMSLRWRRVGARGGHIPWCEIEKLFQRWPETMARWYAQVQQIACELNHKEQLARAQLRYAYKLLEQERTYLLRK